MKPSVIVTLFLCALGVGVTLYVRSPSPSPRASSSALADTAEALPIASPDVSAAPASTLAVAALTPTAAPSAVEPSTESSLAAAMHAVEQSDPARALEMARQGQKRWPHGERAAEFARTEVKCLYALGRPSEGRGAAEAMVNKYVGSPWALEVERETGAHAYVNH